MSVKRVYVEKKPAYAVEAGQLLDELKGLLQINGLTGLRILNRYDVEGIDDALFEQCKPIVFCEPQVDHLMSSLPETDAVLFAVEYLPGQYDQRAASAEECIQLVGRCDRPRVRTAKIYMLEGTVSDEQLEAIKRYVINPVEAREASLEEKDTLAQQVELPDHVATLDGFRAMTEDQLPAFIETYGLAMDEADVGFCQAYFATEQRDPTLTELRMIDTYWSDHCRHTTFLTHLDSMEAAKPEVEKAFRRYLSVREAVYGNQDRPVTLMDMATIGTKYLKKQGMLPDLDESEEINACSIKLTVMHDGKPEPWILMFKNETHNHPTEIEPFGGAATCIGGAIRDPLSGRTYVYQAMRVTGAADPLVPVSETMAGKLPQRKIVTTAAAGYSSYGNQIGLATGLVDEQYHPGYAAKRLEIGAVLGAAPAENIRRERPAPGDRIVLLGGRTGRDGCGGATGSSKSHKLSSLEKSGAEVQKGNALTERKLQRLFRRSDATRLIKRCNDFGAGGVSVAIGELADGLMIDLDKVPKKYDGLDGTELAISESQERMAVVLAPEDVSAFLALAEEENLEATVVAEVTEEPRLRMTWLGHTIVDLSREFLNSNGAMKHADVRVPDASLKSVSWPGATLAEKLRAMLTDLNICAKKGLSERFDSTIGAGSVVMPFGGKKQLTPIQTMVAKLPVQEGDTTTVSGMAYGFHPEVMSQSPYEGAYLAVVESIARLVAAGFDDKKAWLTFQEYFERMGREPERWGQPAAALLGALDAQLDLGIAAIGGKDSMSGTFEKLDVPPTLCSFAVATGEADDLVTPEFKAAGHSIRLVTCNPFDPGSVKQTFAQMHDAAQRHELYAAWAISLGGIAEALFKMGVGNGIGARISEDFEGDLFAWQFGSFVIECDERCSLGEEIGSTIKDWVLEYEGDRIDLAPMQDAWEHKLEPVFPWHGRSHEAAPMVSTSAGTAQHRASVIARPRAFIPVFPGTNCEYDTVKALERAGGQASVLVINNLSPKAIEESLDRAVRMIADSQMIILPGGFSGGDEPDGSAKFITAFFRNPQMKDAVADLLDRRDGLMLGICNGFQALVKLGLVPFGRIVDTDDTCPTLTYNEIGRHQSMLVRTMVVSTQSPWLMKTQPGDIHTVAISHGEGRFVGTESLLHDLATHGQIATQYVDLDGQPTMDRRFNPNGSMLAIEGITSPDGRVLGKMGHSERSGSHLYLNVPGDAYQPIFEGGVAYFA